jgi:hypothetical protein
MDGGPLRTTLETWIPHDSRGATQQVASVLVIAK